MDAAPGTWFQAYLPGDESQIGALIDRVAAAGVQTLVLTVDTPVQANRENNVRAGFSTPLKPGLGLAYQRSEEHTSELQSLMSISYAVFCLNKKTTEQRETHRNTVSKH